jgi:hypothetical protein
MSNAYVLLFPIFFVALWLAITALAARLSGWRAVAERCPAPPGYEPERRHRFQSVVVRRVFWFPARYRGVTTVGLGAGGLYLSLLALFRYQHPPLLIPWNAIARCEDGAMLGVRWLDVELREVDTRLRFYGRIGETIQEEWQRAGGGRTGWR